MSASEITRQAIVAGTKKLASEKPLQKISVLEIAQHCSINRNTFYYYFGDKYDVIAWIFQQELVPNAEASLKGRGLAENVTAMCTQMQREKSFYSRILEDSGHRSFRELLVQYYKKFLMDMAQVHFEAFNLEGRDQEIAARFYAHGTVGMICDWAAGDMKMDSAFATSIIQLSAREKFFV